VTVTTLVINITNVSLQFMRYAWFEFQSVARKAIPTHTKLVQAAFQAADA
jgi:hypothetical protein